MNLNHEFFCWLFGEKSRLDCSVVFANDRHGEIKENVFSLLPRNTTKYEVSIAAHLSYILVSMNSKAHSAAFSLLLP